MENKELLEKLTPKCDRCGKEASNSKSPFVSSCSEPMENIKVYQTYFRCACGGKFRVVLN